MNFYLYTSIFVFGMAFFLSFLIYKSKLPIGNDFSGEGVQKIHTGEVKRIGGCAIVAPIIISFVLMKSQNVPIQYFENLLIALIPIVVFGMKEDLFRNVIASYRLAACFVAALLFLYSSGIWVTEVDLIHFDDVLFENYFFGIVFTCLAVVGISQSFNLIDGLNGLSSGTGIGILFCLSIVALELGDQQLFLISSFFGFATLGFFFVNFPRGRLFLGDAGAYSIGFVVAELLVIFSEIHHLSKWFGFLMCIYPISDTIFTIIRRLYRGQPVFAADSMHLHQIIFQRVVNKGRKEISGIWRDNAIASVITMSFSLTPVFIAFAFRYQGDLLLLFSIIFLFIYFAIYTLVHRLGWSDSPL
jgi:UDP-GlcNAc:undecaprenyl-phosphate GlcNAc-1-phosphate transferase